MSELRLAVPVRVDALVVDAAVPVVGSTLDIARAPWFGAGDHGVERDHFPETANVAGAIRIDPMSENERYLAPGVHLHWALPAATRRGRTDDPGHRSHVPRGGLWFPRAPERWLVVRRVGERAIDAWLVESDHVHAWGTGTESVAYPVPPGDHWTHPYARVGRSTRLFGRTVDGPDIDAGSSLGALDQRSAANVRDAPDVPLASIDAALTAIGPNDPTFAALYPSCSSVFGLHDPEPPDEPATYTVMGWYASAADDPYHRWRQFDQDRTTDTDRAAGDDDAIDRVLRSDLDDDEVKALWLAGTARERAVQILLRERIAWATAPDDVVHLDACVGTVLHGSVQVDPSSPTKPSKTVRPTVAIGTNPREAAAALVAHGHPGDPHVADDLESIAFGAEISDHRLDTATKLVELRHSAGFTTTGSRRMRELRPKVHHDAPAGQARRSGPRPSIPDDLAHLMAELVAAEDESTRAQDELESCRQQLFSDWQVLLLATYRPDDTSGAPFDLDAYRDEVVADALDASIRAEQAYEDARRQVVRRIDTVESALAAWNRSLDPSFQLELARATGPRYWRANDPSIALMETGALRLSDRHRAVPRGASDAMVKCAVRQIDGVPTIDWDRASVESFLDAVDGALPEPGAPAADGSGSEDEPGAILLEWSARVRLLIPHGAERRFDADVLRRRFRLGDMCRFTDIGAENDDAGTWFPIDGRALLHVHGAEILLDPLTPFIDELDRDIEALGAADPRLDEWRRLRARTASLRDELLSATVDEAGPDLITFSLGGLVDRLLMRRVEPQLPIADPLGFPDDQELARGVAEQMVGVPAPASPEPRAPLAPFGGVEIEIDAGRVVDNFGRFTTWEAGEVVVASSLDDGRDGIRIEPRCIQPGRIDMRWLSTRGDIESNRDPETSPICGWIVPDDLDGTIQVHDPSGALLGRIDTDLHYGAVWRAAPGRRAFARRALVEHPHLAAVVDRLVDAANDATTPSEGPGSTSGLGGLLETLDAALCQIDPSDDATHRSTALLVGRPIAIARARVELVRQGAPTADRSVAGIARRLAGGAASDRGAGDVLVPIRLGDHGRRNDGLVGFFVDADDRPSGPLLTCVDGDNTIHRSFDDPATSVTVLVDPRSPVHVTTGILPTKAVSIPNEHFADVLDHIDVLVSAMPVVTVADGVELPLPSEPGHQWSWLALDDGRWNEITGEPTISRSDLRRGLPGTVTVDGRTLDADGLWQYLAEHERITPLPGGQHARLAGAGSVELSPEVTALLTKVAGAVLPAPLHAVFDAPAVVRDGWLRLTRVSTDTSSPPSVAPDDDSPAIPTGAPDTT